MCLSGFDHDSESLHDGEQETLFGHKFRHQHFLSLLSPVSVVMCQQPACHVGEVYGRLKDSLLLSLSP